MTVAPLRLLLDADDASVAHVLRARAAASPEALFLTWGAQSYTYRQALEESQNTARALIELSDGAPARVASFLPNRPEALWTWFAVHLLGWVYVPLHRGQRGAVLQDMLARSGASILVTDMAGTVDLPDLSPAGIRRVAVVDLRAGSPPAVRGGTVHRLEPHDRHCPVGVSTSPFELATVMFTSGTTGRAKAVTICGNQLCRNAARVAESSRLGPADVFHAWLPLYHIAGQVDMVLPTIIGGGSLLLLPTFSGSRFRAQVADARATIFIGFTSLLEILMGNEPRHDDASWTLRTGLVGHVPAELRRPFERRFGVTLLNPYGMTEAEPISFPTPSDPDGSCGRASPDFEVRVTGDRGQTLGPGRVGEIQARALVPGVMTLGYEDNAEATRTKIVEGWLRTGDLGRMDRDGFIYFVDRLKHVIRRRGENMSSWEVEHSLLANPKVEAIAAIGVPSPLGEDDLKVVVVTELEAHELHGWCRDNLARFMVPRFIERIDALPTTDSGKVRKELLRAVGPETWDAEAAGERR